MVIGQLAMQAQTEWGGEVKISLEVEREAWG